MRHDRSRFADDNFPTVARHQNYSIGIFQNTLKSVFGQHDSDAKIMDEPVQCRENFLRRSGV
jgi:hypothetical protein